MNDSSSAASTDLARRLARVAQQTLFRGRCPQCPFADMAVRYVPLETVGGDFYDFALAKSGHPAFLIGDVSGHGMAAALVTAWILGYVRKFRQAHVRPRNLIMDLRALINELADGAGDEAPFCTAFYAIYDASQRDLTYCNAGHPAPILIDADGQRVASLTSQCLLIAATTAEHCPGQEHHAEVPRGGRLALYTDGLIETFGREGQQWGAQHLNKVLRETRPLPAEEAADGILARAAEFAGDGGFQDDVTLILIDFP